MAAPAIASIHLYPEGADQVMWRSLQTLRDQNDRAWQVVLFKRVHNGTVSEIHLRLVGFPGGATLEHGRSLEIINTSDVRWTAEDVFAIAKLSPTVADNVGEYDFLPILSKIQTDSPLRLQLPLQGKPSSELLIPPFAVREWRQLMDR